MEIARWMKHPVVTAKPLDTVRHARELMAAHRVNQLPVVRDGRLVGIVTDRDVRDASPSVFEAATRRGPENEPSATVPVEDVMTANVLTLPPTASIADAARLMRRERIGALPIVDRGRLVGLLARSDVLDAFAALVDGTDAAAARNGTPA